MMKYEKLLNESGFVDVEVYNEYRQKIADGFWTELDLILAINKAVNELKLECWRNASKFN